MKKPQRNHGDHGGATAFYAVQTPQWHRASGVTGVEGPRFRQLSAVLRRSMTEPLRNHGDHGDATAVHAVQAPQWHRASGVTGVLIVFNTSVLSMQVPRRLPGKTKPLWYSSDTVDMSFLEETN